MLIPARHISFPMEGGSTYRNAKPCEISCPPNTTTKIKLTALIHQYLLNLNKVTSESSSEANFRLKPLTSPRGLQTTLLSRLPLYITFNNLIPR